MNINMEIPGLKDVIVEKVEAFEDAIAKAHDGYLTNEIVIAEYKDLLSSVGETLKN